MTINELTEYVLEFCRPLIYDYIFLKKNEFALTEFNSNVLMNPDELLTISEKQHNDFKKLFQRYLQTSKSMTHIKDKITFWWKGEKKTIEAINVNIKSSFSSPMFMFAFYDILYKFYIGTVLYYITVEYILNPSIYTIVIDPVLNAYYIHRNYKIFINEYVNYITNILSTSTTINLLNELQTKLQVLGISIIIPQEFTIKSENNKNVDIINHIVMDVEEINKNYEDLKYMYNHV